MNSATATSGAGVCPATHGSPVGLPEEGRQPLYSVEFAADPQAVYARLREQFGSLAPVELAPGVAATLVLGYYTAIRILHDPQHFPADPRTWQRSLPPGCPIESMVEWRPNAIRSDGSTHERYRHATVDALAGVDLHALHSTVEAIAVPLINTFCEQGSAELIGEYTMPLVFTALNQMVGCPDDIGQRLVAGFAAMFDGGDAAAINTVVDEAMSELIALKRRAPGDDIATRLVQHPLALDDEELIQQLVTIYAAGFDPTQILIGTTLRLMVTDTRFAGSVLGGSLSARAAVEEVLFTDPPMSNYCLSYPRQPVLIDGVWLPADQPVLISMAACNSDPAIVGGDRSGNASHLAFSAGPHACPARQMASQIAADAIDQLLDALPDIQLATPNLAWRPGPFHRALTELPVVFPPTPPLDIIR
ncbi:cytochrome P450 [Nocardia cyriacigeorgica]|uniref:cytochrome P450 n=1 Tax=Nocardia cyriacigeorgica TaxID=135487 RepID=UPI001893E029|nr:cytochrome P450 [Nocardia cyriacigeorgica]MBF6324760.1 cytochrome P450 [Nocardia cyriacigeorgica]